MECAGVYPASSNNKYPTNTPFLPSFDLCSGPAGVGTDQHAGIIGDAHRKAKSQAVITKFDLQLQSILVSNGVATGGDQSSSSSSSMTS